MSKIWDTIFKDEVEIWGTAPSYSAILVKDFFLSQGVRKILIPGVGYGRNAKIFIDNKIEVTGIEISKSAIKVARNKLKLDIEIHHGSVLEMPFDNKIYDGIFCYALIHLLDYSERIQILQNCNNQLDENRHMFFTVISKQDSMYGKGRKISDDQYEISQGLNVFFYDEESIEKEFTNFGLVDYQFLEEPIKFKANEPALKCFLVKCQKV